MITARVWCIAILLGALMGCSTILGPQAKEERASGQEDPILCQNEKYNDKDLEYATLYAILNYVDEGRFRSWEDSEKAWGKLQNFNRWLLAQPEGRARKAYAGWVSYYERRYKEFDESLRHGDTDTAWAEIKQQLDRGKSLADCLPKPEGN